MTNDELRERRIAKLAALMDCDVSELTAKIDVALAKRDAAKRASDHEA
jgi:hypothetical protein